MGTPKVVRNSLVNVTFLCAITPVFEPCLPAFKLLTQSLLEQTFQDFIHIAISNGKSASIQEWTSSLKNSRFIYDELAAESTPTLSTLLCNLGKRRNHCLKKYDADRFVFLDADLKITDNAYFQKLWLAHNDAAVLLTKVKNGPTTLPKFPIERGRIDIANYSFNREIAKKVDYPTDIDFRYGIANDFRFYERLGRYSWKVLPDICAIKDGNKCYTRLSERGGV
jgi:hypothetical protein